MSVASAAAAGAPLPVRRQLAAMAHNRRFWAIQGTVALVAALHDPAEAGGLFPDSGILHDVPHEFIRDFFFIIPVTYAALRFGLVGALVTALACTVITLPNWILLHHSADRIGPMAQLTVVYVVAVFVGSRVDREAAALALARAAARSLESSEARYRGVFEAASDGMLVLDEQDVITASNATASAICGRAPGDSIGRPAADVLPPQLLRRLDGPDLDQRADDPVPVRGLDGAVRWVVPVTRSLGERERSRIVLLRDVSEQRRRQEALEHFTAEMLRTQEEERQRIAQELHDDTVQALVLLCRRLDVLADERGDGASPRERAQLLALRSLTESSLVSLRDYLRGLRPSVLDDLGLVAAMRRLTADPGLRAGLTIAFEPSEEDRRLSPESELALYRIAQEALRNADRHSGARRVTVTLRFEKDDAELTVADDGSGFARSANSAALASTEGLGLRGMQERARYAGGSLSVRSAPGRGTTVIARVPHSGRPPSVRPIEEPIEEARPGGPAPGSAGGPVTA